MDITFILIGSFIILIGLQLCSVEKGTVEEVADMPGICPWCKSPFLKIIYGLSQTLGAISVLGLVFYLTFFVHWWYFLLYIGGLILATGISFILKLCLIPVIGYYKRKYMFAETKVKRFVGTILVLMGIIICVYSII